ncbi:hypothetical protein SAMN02744133_102474 [Thalassospira xiamenensis M-5 = DSM 17429]|uniref:Uncharacterized protein n=1 Tax=Thalassospira xiamenensis M-5 = DSM 17429 TaxID=1123366 RepID=A0AB72U821_9PROT|nr:TraK family protein [Thalassospira xiamenensis]AJD50321.1 hypothetical protein TH3_00975 [Thalassospira xiamenensis M-5 = DSM 17429]SIS81287.1 hypothetical protein SAMN02744133_102474 [Thalassospira xiamenensis M-5 = DSM 17429]
MAGIWGQARIELLALQNEILAEIEKGISARQIFDQLSADGRITISRRSFYRRVKLLRAEHHQQKSSVKKSPPLQTSMPSTRAHLPTDNQATSSLPTLKPKEQTEFNRIWNGEPADEEESQ